jgi:asparagine synthase (glutamine-hydrolysing)
MCGIAGFCGKFPEWLPEKMIDAIAHRGPDDRGCYINKKAACAIAQARLAIIDLSPAGHQPMFNSDRTLAVVFNGEIYNFRELKQELLNDGQVFKSRSDTEVLLHLYEKMGEAMLEKLNGVFAFAIFDAGKNSIFLARDQFGVKPLYLAFNQSGIMFCSEIKGFLRCPDFNNEIDPVALNKHLAFIYSPGSNTMFKSVKKLRPGFACILKNGRIEREYSYYKLPYDGTRSDLSCEQAAKKVEEYFSRAVKRQLVSDVPVGAFLSGGLDSSAIVAMMKEHMPGQSFPCYSIGFADEKDNEGCPADLPYAEKVARHLDLDLHRIEVSPEDLIERTAELIWFLDEPQADPAPVNAMIIAQKARADGIKVLLSGAGGDDIFSGYRRHLAIKYDSLFDFVPSPLLRLGNRIAKKALDIRNHHVRRLIKVLNNADLDRQSRLFSYYKWSSDNLRSKLLSANVKKEAFVRPVEKPFTEMLELLSAETDSLNQMLILDTAFFLPDHNLNYTDKTCMRYGVEARVPLLDPDLVCLAAQIEPKCKQTFHQGKAVFKKAMEKYLPHEVIYRPKTHFGAPLRRWIQNDLKNIIDKMLGKNTIESRGLFSYGAVRQLIEDDRAGKVDGSYIIFSLLCIEIWCQLFVDRVSYKQIKI